MTTTTEDATKPAAVERNTQLEGKWGKKVIEAGYTSVPDVLIRYQQRLKLKPLDVNVLLHLLSYWWKAPGLPRRGQDRGLGPARVHSAICGTHARRPTGLVRCEGRGACPQSAITPGACEAEARPGLTGQTLARPAIAI